MKYVIAILLVLFAFSGCTQVQQQEQITVTLQVHDVEANLVFEKEINSVKGASAFEVLQQNNIPMETDDFGFGVFIKSIAGVVPEENQYLGLNVNEEYSQVGISDIKLENGMIIDFSVEEIDESQVFEEPQEQ
ncbi:MAG: DUF4430 domain-containing protein [archaeon]|nr:DUF4430 domain-containing protein [archaeon]